MGSTEGTLSHSMKLLMLLSLFLLGTASMVAGFVLDSLTMDQNTLASCCTCDSMGDFMFNIHVAKALREYMSKNRVRMAIERGDIKIGFSLPNEGIDTGHSCKVTAEARNIKLKAEMLNDKDYLDKNLASDYDEGELTSFIDGNIKHKVDITADIRHRFGAKIFGSCKRYGRKTCGITATSTGTNLISVILAINSTACFSEKGQQKVAFTLNVFVDEQVSDRTYSPTTIKPGKCRLPFNIFNLKSKVQRYATTYINKRRYKPEMSDRLIRKLEEILKAPLNKPIVRPVNVVGGSSRGKRATIVDCSKKKTCPKGFSRIVNTENCKRHFGFKRPNCSYYARNAKLKYRYCCRGTRSIYWCEAPMM